MKNNTPFLRESDRLKLVSVTVSPAHDSFDWMLNVDVMTTKPRRRPRCLHIRTQNFDPTPHGLADALENAAEAIRDSIRYPGPKGRQQPLSLVLQSIYSKAIQVKFFSELPRPFRTKLCGKKKASDRVHIVTRPDIGK